MTQNTTSRSGTYNTWPRILPAPTFIGLDDAPQINGLLCYVLRHYGHDGISALVCRQPTSTNINVRVIFSDWRGALLDMGVANRLQALSMLVMADYIGKITQVMKLIKIPLAQFYFASNADKLFLVDIQTAIDKLAGPGMVRDLFGKIIPVQDTIKIENMDQRALSAIRAGAGNYAGNLMIKPSRFRTTERAAGRCPLYVEIER